MTAPFILRWAQTNTQNRTTITMMSPMWGAPDPEEKVLDWKQQARLQLKQTRTLSLFFLNESSQTNCTFFKFTVPYFQGVIFHISSHVQPQGVTVRFQVAKVFIHASPRVSRHSGEKKTTKEGPSEILIPSKYFARGNLFQTANLTIAALWCEVQQKSK